MAEWYSGASRFGVTVQVKENVPSPGWVSVTNDRVNNHPGSLRTALGKLRISGGVWLSKVKGTIVRHSTVQETLGRRNSWRDHWRYHTADLYTKDKSVTSFYVSIACDNAELGSDKPGQDVQIWRTIKAWDNSGNLVFNSGREKILQNKPESMGRTVINYEKKLDTTISRVQAYVEYYVGSNKWHNWKNSGGRDWHGFEPGTTLGGYYKIPMSWVSFDYNMSPTSHQTKKTDDIYTLSSSS